MLMICLRVKCWRGTAVAVICDCVCVSLPEELDMVAVRREGAAPRSYRDMVYNLYQEGLYIP